MVHYSRKFFRLQGVVAATMWLVAGSLCCQSQTVFTSSGGITINNTTTGTVAASPSPSTVSVTGLSGTITKLVVQLTGVTSPGECALDVLLVSPTGAKLVLMADAGGNACNGINNVSLVFDDAAAATLPVATDPVSGTFKPAAYHAMFSEALNFGAIPVPPSAIPQPSGLATLSNIFAGTAPNGTWSLYVVEDATGQGQGQSTLAGWSLTITTGTAVAPTVTTVVSSTSGNSLKGDNVLFNVQVTSTSTVTAGTVSFVDGATSLGAAVAVASGVATLNTSLLTEGLHTITAKYSGSATFGSSSGSATQTVAGRTTVNGTVYSNTNAITIPQAGFSGSPDGDPSAPYPSQIFVGTNGAAALSGVITSLSVGITNFQHNNPADVAMLLVGPKGQALEIWSRAGVSSGNPVSIVLSDLANIFLPDNTTLSGGTYHPTAYRRGNSDVFPLPAQSAFSLAAPSGGENSRSLLQTFAGTDPNGVWKLYLMDLAIGGSGQIASGWSLSFGTSPAKPSTVGLTSSLNPALPGSPVTYLATATDASTHATLTSGTITFSDGTTNLTSPLPVSASGQASFTTTYPAEGSHTLLATYNGPGGGNNPGFGSLTQLVDNATLLISGNRFYNPSPITLPAAGSQAGPALPYGSHLTVSHAGGVVTKVSLNLSNLSYSFPRDLQMLLVNPDGTNFEVWGHVSTGNPANNVTISLDDQGSPTLTNSAVDLASGTFKPACTLVGDIFPAPATTPFFAASPAGSATLASAFNNRSANGVWTLYISSTVNGSFGSLANGWSLTLNTVPAVTTNPLAQAVCSGTLANFTAAAEGLPTPSIQWQVNAGTGFTNILGANTASLVLAATPAMNGYLYRAALTNANGFTNSASAQLTVLASPLATITPTPVTVCAGSAGNQASGPGGLASYAWSISNGTITSATNTQSITYSAGLGGSVSLQLVTANASGCIASNSATVPIASAALPSFIQVPSQLCPGGSGYTASSITAASAYSWTINGGTIVGSTNTQTISFRAGNGTNVSLTLVVFNAGGCSATTSTNLPVGDLNPPYFSFNELIITNVAKGTDKVIVNYGVTAADACGPVPVTFAPPAGTALPVGMNFITFTASNALGHASTATLEVWVMATNIVVINPKDNGPGSLRDAMNNVVAGGAVTFAANLAGATITLTNGEIILSQNVSLSGLGADKLKISGNHASRIFTIQTNSTNTISGLNLVDGNGQGYNGPAGGAIYNAGILFLRNLAISSSGTTNFNGGAIFTSGPLHISASVIGPGNQGNIGGGIYGSPGAALDLLNCTVAGNTGITVGGVAMNSSTTCWLTNCTISANSDVNYAGGFGGLAPNGLLNTIIAGNSSGTYPDLFVSGNIGSLGHNLIGVTNNTPGWLANDLIGTQLNPLNPRLGPLTNNGGPTLTMALLLNPNSPAIDAGAPIKSTAFDQRGSGFPRVVGSAIDIGALELARPQLTLQLQGSQVILSWPISIGTGYTLQKASPLPPEISPLSWITLSVIPTQNATDYRVTLPASGVNGFYRLHAQ